MGKGEASRNLPFCFFVFFGFWGGGKRFGCEDPQRTTAMQRA